MTPTERAERVKAAALGEGFDRVGITGVGPLAEAEFYRRWLAEGRAGSMGYLHRYADLRASPAGLVAGARSIICVALGYRREDAPPAPDDATPRGKVARYARGADYHRVLHEKLGALRERLAAEMDEPFEARAFVDTGPLLERQLAARAGIGWVGKNTLVLHERLGSYLFLGELVTTLELAADPPATDHCGTCTRCLDACPTQAFPAAYQMDATRCISYLTIEHRGAIAPELQARMGDWVYGCDICQEVCPFNRKAPLTRDAELAAEVTPAYPSLLELVQLRSGDYRRLTRGSASRRATRAMWVRNGEIALRNVGGGEK